VELSVGAMVYLNQYKGYNKGNARIVSLYEDWNSSLEFSEDMYQGGMIRCGTLLSVNKASLTNALSPGQWHYLLMSVGPQGYQIKVDDKLIGSTNKTEISNWGHKPAVLEIGNFDGYIDEVVVKSKAKDAGQVAQEK